MVTRSSKDTLRDRKIQIRAALSIAIPLIGTLLAISLAYVHSGIRPMNLVLCAIMYLATMFGLTAGYHRLFSHASFKPVRALKIGLAIAGSMAAQGPVMYWASIHRRHHRYSDSPGDPHSPCLEDKGSFVHLRGLLHAHMGWLFDTNVVMEVRNVRDLIRDKDILFIDRRYVWWVLAGLFIPAAVGLQVEGTLNGSFDGFLWGGLVRMFLVNHSVWSVNSFCHYFGYQRYHTNDHSKNNWLLAILVLGDGWHNNHHARPGYARHGRKWWEFDPTYLMLKLFGKLGWVADIRTEVGVSSKSLS